MPIIKPENLSIGLSIPELRTPFLFSDRRVDLPADLRPAWRIGIIVLLMKLCCRESKARFRQLHVLNWGVRNRRNRDLLMRAVSNDVPIDTVLVRIEPSLNRAVDLALGEGLIERLAGDQLQLTGKGTDLADAIQQTKGLFQQEKAFMNVIKKKVNERFVSELFG
jgi:hypothetical protein